MFKRYFFFALKNIKHRRLRSFLTVIGIFIGVFLIVSLMSIGEGMQIAINEEFEKTGSNRIMVVPGGINFGPVSSQLSTAKLTENDLKEIAGVNGVERAMIVLSRTAKVEYKDELKYVSIWGVSTDSESLELIKTTRFFDVEIGSEFKGSSGARAILGNNIAEKEFGEKIKVGGNIKMNGKEFKVIGIQKKAGDGIHDMIIRVPLEEARVLFDEKEDISIIIATTHDSSDIDKVVEDIRRKLRNSRDVKAGEEDFSVETTKQTIERFSDILKIVQIVLVGIAAISLLVGGIGIMNTTYTSVLERRKEIGTMKAIGATGADIVFIFLTEAGLLGLVGGSLGVLGGLGLARGIEAIFAILGYSFFKAYLGLPLIAGAFIFSFIAGAASGVLPAFQASRLNPVEAFRS